MNILSWNSIPVLPKRQFRYELTWQQHRDYEGVVTQGWATDQSGSLLYCMTSKLSHCRKHLVNWCKHTVGTSRHAVERLQKELAELQLEEQSETNVTRQRLLVDEINSLWSQEEAYWFQRARINWMLLGDRNSKFFHATASRRRQNNYIFQLKNDQGILLEGTDSILAHAYSHFQQAYDSPETCNFNQIEGLIRPSVTGEMNEDLCQNVSDEEVRATVFQMGAFKAPGVDGFPGCFFQKHWDIVGTDVCKAVQHFFTNGFMLREMNKTKLVLIPKVKNPESAFVPGRTIQDNILIAHEAFHGLHLKKSATSEKKISGYKIRRRSPTISHLLFADDSLIFCRATMEEVNSSSENHSVFSYVCELLDDRGEWDITKLNASFSNQVSREILKIPTGACADSLVWHYDKYGNFSVKSAYLLAYNAAHDLGMHDTNRSLNNVEWKHLWKLQVPPKVRIFLWRAILNSLPSLDNLVKRGVSQEITCPNCHIADETLMHLLLYCPHVEPIWFGSALGLDPRQLGVNCFSEWWRYINGIAKQMGIPSMVEQCAIICWHIWKARNEQYFEHVALNPHQILARISAMTQECSSLMNKHLLVSPSSPRAQGKQQQAAWVKPPMGFLKVNVDASYSPQTGSAAFAMDALCK
ncbi:hypothetical protein SLA2020_088170 [Shorea laevis]